MVFRPSITRRTIILTEFKELKIDEELRNLLPPLSTEEYEGLEKSILENGFDRTKPIATWKGYIADGHNRYSVCQKHKIPFISFELASTIATKADVIKWMLDGQLNRRNLSPAQRVAIAKKYEDSIRAVAKERQAEYFGNQYSDIEKVDSYSTELKSTPMITQNEIAKIAQVSPATVARYDVVMKSDEEDLKEQMKKSDITIRKAYDEVKKREKARKKIEVPVIAEYTPLTPEESEAVYQRYRKQIEEANAGARFKDDGSPEAQAVKAVKAIKSPIIIDDLVVQAQDCFAELIDIVEEKASTFVAVAENISEDTSRIDSMLSALNEIKKYITKIMEDFN